jgi:hypothetical protein
MTAIVLFCAKEENPIKSNAGRRILFIKMFIERKIRKMPVKREEKTMDHLDHCPSSFLFSASPAKTSFEL